MKAKLIHVVIHAGGHGLLTATSPDHNGLRVTAHSLDALLSQIPLVIEALYRATGCKVTVHQVDGSKSHDLTWVVVPESQSLDQCA